MSKRSRSNKRFLPKSLATLQAADFLTRARQYHTQAIELEDMVAYEPNWPKHFLMTHAIELAITAYLIFERGLNEARRGKWPEAHDLEALYEEAVRRGLESNQLVLKDLPYLSELHKVHYARYPKIEVKGVPRPHL
jgi:hypothetical protein